MNKVQVAGYSFEFPEFVSAVRLISLWAIYTHPSNWRQKFSYSSRTSGNHWCLYNELFGLVCGLGKQWFVLKPCIPLPKLDLCASTCALKAAVLTGFCLLYTCAEWPDAKTISCFDSAKWPSNGSRINLANSFFADECKIFSLVFYGRRVGPWGKNAWRGISSCLRQTNVFWASRFRSVHTGGCGPFNLFRVLNPEFVCSLQGSFYRQKQTSFLLYAVL